MARRLTWTHPLREPCEHPFSSREKDRAETPVCIINPVRSAEVEVYDLSEY